MTEKEIEVMRRYAKAAAFVAVCGLLAWGIGRAAISKYQQKRQEIFTGCQAERAKLSPADLKALPAKCPTPEVSLVSPAMLTPGQTAEVSVTGKFPAGSRVLFTSDCLEVLKEATAANSYRATVKVGADCGPQKVNVEVIVPVCCKTGRGNDAITVGGNFVWDMTASNGWRVAGRAELPAPGEQRSSDIRYMLEFYRGSETAPFTKHRATLFPSGGDVPSYTFSIESQESTGSSPMEEMTKIGEAMRNPNLSDADRDKLMKRVEDLTAAMTKEAQKMGDPNYIKQLQAKEELFGCTNIYVTAAPGGVLSGNMRCSQKVGNNLKITGTMKYLGK
jgi:hypothetical protein